MHRDFSENSKKELLALVAQVEDEKINNFTDWFGDRWYDFESWIGVLNIKNYLDDVNAYHKKVIDKNNATEETIEDIFAAVKYADQTYGVYFEILRVQLLLWNRYIMEMQQIVNPVNGSFTAEYIASSMTQVLNRYTSYLDWCAGNTDALQQNFIEFDVTSLFIDGRNSTIDGLAVGYASNWLETFYSLIDDVVDLEGIDFDNVNEAIVRKSIETVIAEVLDDENAIEKFIEEFTDDLMPEEIELGKKAIETILKLGKTLTAEELAEILDIDVREITESDYLKYLTRTETLESLKQLSTDIKLLNNIADIADVTETVSKALIKIYHDYSAETAYLEAIKQALIDTGYNNATVNSVIEEMLWAYENQYASAAGDLFKEMIEIMAKEGTTEVLPLLSTFLAVKDVTASIIGLKDRADNLGTVYATQQYSYALVKKFEEYKEIINSGNYTQDDVTQCKMYFSLAKAAKLQEYEAIQSVLENSTNLLGDEEREEGLKAMLDLVKREIERLEGLTLNL